ncbi:MAG: periplasmic heavy metal sensor [Desulfobacterales bacterium]|jgi:hypothetical protein|nr:periplasmic heavy metal sensor [Desulfobacterales bacterium]
MLHLTGRKIVMVASLVLTVAFSTWAFAAEESVTDAPKAGAMGYHHGGSPHGKGGPADKASGMPCGQNLSKEEMEKIQAVCERFFKDTESLRMDIKSKHLAVKSELAKAAPNGDNALALQKELSTLEAQLDQKRIVHFLEIKKISPTAAMGCMDGRMKRHMDKGPKQMSGDCPMMGGQRMGR